MRKKLQRRMPLVTEAQDHLMRRTPLQNEATEAHVLLVEAHASNRGATPLNEALRGFSLCDVQAHAPSVRRTPL